MKRVGMFVWNHFTNDARVMRECTTLSQNGYDVELICIDDPDDPTIKRYEEINEHFRVHRMKRYPSALLFLQKVYRFVVGKRWPIIPFGLVWAYLVYLLPWIILPLTLLAVILLKTKARVIWVRGALILRMMWKGHRGNYDIYHSNDLNTMPQGYVSAKWRFKKKPLIYDSHEVQTSRTGYDSPWYEKFERFFIKRMDAMMVENDTRAKYNEDLYGFYPYVLHNYPTEQISEGTDKVDLHSMLNLPPDEKILLYQGGIQIGRGLDKLVEAYPKFKEGTLVFIGDGRIKEELQQKVKENNLEDGIRFLPKVPLKDLPKYTRNGYLGFQVLNNICFNHYSASSNKLFEYMMAEVPVVACDFPEIKKVVEGNEIGITVDSHNPEDIARGVNYMLEHPEERDRFSKNCIPARGNYNWENEQENLLEVYEQF
ncbi:glycosyltransferase involved in cell wall biosynthesis [Gracilibacillus halotolerans]|uniref:Glycosyltransferase involved in cell wall biosynthesis n=1 Tax=Gracilibacillus halotolerans TaxID=74386 RepID=A0A841RNY8_9BACI|nr:glycosyltransferase [Gracilibacillus halotolerans]MBB6513592.1 glycosyltransferase involved in cell wall biosynthesis [Gracilibacillus halotolerans]